MRCIKESMIPKKCNVFAKPNVQPHLHGVLNDLLKQGSRGTVNDYLQEVKLLLRKFGISMDVECYKRNLSARGFGHPFRFETDPEMISFGRRIDSLLLQNFKLNNKSEKSIESLKLWMDFRAMIIKQLVTALCKLNFLCATPRLSETDRKLMSKAYSDKFSVVSKPNVEMQPFTVNIDTPLYETSLILTLNNVFELEDSIIRPLSDSELALPNAGEMYPTMSQSSNAWISGSPTSGPLSSNSSAPSELKLWKTPAQATYQSSKVQERTSEAPILASETPLPKVPVSVAQPVDLWNQSVFPFAMQVNFHEILEYSNNYNLAPIFSNSGHDSDNQYTDAEDNLKANTCKSPSIIRKRTFSVDSGYESPSKETLNNESCLKHSRGLSLVF